VLVRDPERVAPYWDQGHDVVIGDLRDPDTAKRAVHGVDAVVHLAAVDPDVAARLGRAALDAGVPRFVFASTILVYGPGQGRPAHENDEPASGSAAAERALLDLHHGGGLGLRIVRLAFVYGDGDPLPRVATGPAHRRIQTVHHADVARGLRLALAADRVDGRIFNLADDAALTAWELCALSGQPAGDGPLGDGPADPWAGLVDTRRIRTELGFRPIYPTVYTAHAAGAM
jgi:nucleoside-diphosphate-sugar epimerase